MKRLSSAANEDLGAKLSVNKISVIIDETTDVRTLKFCAAIVKYFDKDKNTINVGMLGFLDIFSNNDSNGSTGPIETIILEW